MKKICWMVVPCILGLCNNGWGWSAVTHAYIAVCVTDGLNKSVIFGSGAPDVNGMLEDYPEAAEALRQLTHADFDLLAPSAFTTGFTTHNEIWGADSYAHGEDTYAAIHMADFESELGITSTQAHVLFEGCIDAQIRLAHGPQWGTWLAESARASGQEHEDLMAEAYAKELSARVDGLGEGEADELIRTAMQDLQAQTIQLGELLERPTEEAESLVLLYLASYMGISQARAAECYDYAMNATRSTFQAELDAVCAAIKVNMPNAAEGEDVFEGEGEGASEGESQSRGVRITACTLAPNPADPGKAVSLSGLAGQYHGGGVANTIKLTVGFRDNTGAWKGGEPKVVWSGVLGTEWQSWSGNAEVIAPAAPGTYYLWVRNTATLSDSAAISDFKNASPTAGDEELNDKWDSPLTVFPPYGLRLTACSITPNPGNPGTLVALNGMSGQVRGTSGAEALRITAGFRDASGHWAGGEPVVVYSGVPGTVLKNWSGVARVAAPVLPGKYHAWVRLTPASTDGAAVQDFKSAVPTEADERRDDRWGTTLTISAVGEGEGLEGETDEGEVTEGEGEYTEGESTEGEGEPAEGEDAGPCGCGADSSKSLDRLLGDWFLAAVALMALTAVPSHTRHD